MPGPVVEDALRAREGQAESVVERLLEELAEPGDQPPPVPPSLPSTSTPPTTEGNSRAKEIGYSRNANTPNAVSVGAMIVGTSVRARMIDGLRCFGQAELFQDSPPCKGAPTTLSNADTLKESRHESGWWLKRISRKQFLYFPSYEAQF